MCNEIKKLFFYFQTSPLKSEDTNKEQLIKKKTKFSYLELDVEEFVNKKNNKYIQTFLFFFLTSINFGDETL